MDSVNFVTMTTRSTFFTLDAIEAAFLEFSLRVAELTEQRMRVGYQTPPHESFLQRFQHEIMATVPKEDAHKVSEVWKKLDEDPAKWPRFFADVTGRGAKEDDKVVFHVSYAYYPWFNIDTAQKFYQMRTVRHWISWKASITDWTSKLEPAQNYPCPPTPTQQNRHPHRPKLCVYRVRRLRVWRKGLWGDELLPEAGLSDDEGFGCYYIGVVWGGVGRGDLLLWTKDRVFDFKAYGAMYNQNILVLQKGEDAFAGDVVSKGKPNASSLAGNLAQANVADAASKLIKGFTRGNGVEDFVEGGKEVKG
ncbi:hypothetical protein HK097_005710, partial [Rhizophlyctis rosea]